jgi:hypothetical protein
MTPRALRFLLPLALSAAPAVFAQEMAPRPTPLADALASQVRILAASPRDLSALISAGMLSVKLADPAAALAFFSRAQSLSPGDPRIAAGKAGALVLLERPGEALQLYQVAERAGLSMRPYLAERGLAYDLTGQPGHAQRDYRAALADAPEDETVRRLALSLGVSGKRDEAMTLLDPLLRKSDRAAWRARACILAVAGDAAAGERIATNMMPGGAALGPFLRRLQWLSLADRAFAVHFGSLNTTVARQNDARLAPAVAMLPPEPAPLPPATQVAGRRGISARPEDRRNRRDGRGEPVRVAMRTPIPTPVVISPQAFVPPSAVARTETTTALPVRTPLPSPSSTQVASASPITSATAGMEIFTPPPRSPVRFAALAPTSTPAGTAPTPALRALTSSPEPAPAQPATVSGRTLPATAASGVPGSGWAASADAAPAAVVAPATVARTIEPAPTPAVLAAAPAASPRTIEPLPINIVAAPAPLPVAVVAEPPVPAEQPGPSAAEARATASVPPGSSSAASPGSAAVAATPASNPASVSIAAPAPASRPRASALDSIVSGIGIPAEELEVRRAIPRVVPTVAKLDAKSVSRPKTDAPKPDVKKAKPDPAKAEPARWWAQVAGGANAGDLGKDWKRLAAKSPVAFRGKSAWMTPVRSTNRLLAGPFRAQGEAMAFVNLLAKDGASAFAWQSEAGQVVTKLATK